MRTCALKCMGYCPGLAHGPAQRCGCCTASKTYLHAGFASLLWFKNAPSSLCDGENFEKNSSSFSFPPFQYRSNPLNEGSGSTSSKPSAVHVVLVCGRLHEGVSHDGSQCGHA